MKDFDQKAVTTPGRQDGDNGQGPGLHPEPAPVQFLHLLWRRRLLIAAGSLIPALLAALLLFLWPRQYTATFVYEHSVRESEYNVLVHRFSSLENLGKIAGQLREKGLTACAQELLDCRSEDSLEKLVRLTASPGYPKRLQTTDPATSEKIGALQAQLVSIRIAGGSRQEVETVAAVVTGNFEHVLPMYAIRNDLKELTRRYEAMAADIEDGRFALSLELEREQARLDKLKVLDGPPADPNGQGSRGPTEQDRLLLQFTDVKGSREFLPLSYQVRAVQSKIIDLQETIRGNEDKYKYYVGVLVLTHKLLDQAEQSLLTHYTVQQFLSFVGEQLLAYKEKAEADYLKAYMRRTENLVLVTTRAGQNPVIYPVPKHTAGISLLVLIASMMAMTFTAVMLEHPHGQSSRDRP
jgi:hypothetical protein